MNSTNSTNSYLPWHIAGSYYEVCNCEAICPCRRSDGRMSGRLSGLPSRHRRAVLELALAVAAAVGCVVSWLESRSTVGVAPIARGQISIVGRSLPRKSMSRRRLFTSRPL